MILLIDECLNVVKLSDYEVAVIDRAIRNYKDLFSDSENNVSHAAIRKNIDEIREKLFEVI